VHSVVWRGRRRCGGVHNTTRESENISIKEEKVKEKKNCQLLTSKKPWSSGSRSSWSVSRSSSSSVKSSRRRRRLVSEYIIVQTAAAAATEGRGSHTHTHKGEIEASKHVQYTG
jgi:hypothetical protein